ncbi:MAG: hypothetical protein KAR47_17585, partial [Planctomycetes bacterium]|nr:hypothetical protein [Planctomycetota bacterium]
IDAEPGVGYETQFIGTMKGFDSQSKPVKNKDGKPLKVTREYSDDIGIVLKEVEGNSASYTLTGKELYVRAKITSTVPKENCSIVGFTETAWTQPVLPTMKPSNKKP